MYTFCNFFTIEILLDLYKYTLYLKSLFHVTERFGNNDWISQDNFYQTRGVGFKTNFRRCFNDKLGVHNIISDRKTVVRKAKA